MQHEQGEVDSVPQSGGSDAVSDSDASKHEPMDDYSLGPNPVLAWLVRKGPAITALLVFALGPVVMWTTHFVYLRMGLLAGVERPLTYFLSATWGDALILPALGYLCVSALSDLSKHGPPACLRGWLAWVPLIWAVASTAILNAFWLSDANNTNWTQPIGGSWLGSELTLNTAGWLHAAFFVAMQWLIAEFTLRLVMALYGAYKNGVDGEAVGAALGRVMVRTNAILLLSLVFSALLLKDYWEQVTTSQPGQTWTWFIMPGVVLALWLVANGMLLCIVARDVQAHRGAGMYLARRSLGTIVVGWSVLLGAASLGVVWLRLPSVFSMVSLLIGSCIALAVLAAVNVWAEVYWMQRRRPQGFVAAAALTAVVLVPLAGFMLGLDFIVSHEPIGVLTDLLGPWLGALVLALMACAIAAAVGIALEGYESLTTASLDRCCHDSNLYCLGTEPPQHDIVQNVIQFGALYGLLPLYAAAYVVLAEPLMLGKLDTGTQVSLLFGYAGVVVAAVTFPLYNNMQYIRDLEKHKAELGGPAVKHGAEELMGDPEIPRNDRGEATRLERVAYLDADKSFTMALSITVGIIAVLSAMWLWITVLDLILAAA